MARSTYIYLVRRIKTDDLVGACTVKHEAHKLRDRSDWAANALKLSRLRDGVEQEETNIPWDDQDKIDQDKPEDKPSTGHSMTRWAESVGYSPKDL